MSAAQAGLLIAAVGLADLQRLALMLPLCLSIAIVYKTTRCENLRDLPAAALALWVTIVLGMYVVGFGLWAVFTIMV